MDISQRMQTIEKKIADILPSRKKLEHQEFRLRDELAFLRDHQDLPLSSRNRLGRTAIAAAIARDAIGKCLARYDGGLTVAQLYNEMTIAGHAIRQTTLRSYLHRMKEAEQVSLHRRSHKWTVRKNTS